MIKISSKKCSLEQLDNDNRKENHSVCERIRRNIQMAIIKNYLENWERSMARKRKREEYRWDYGHMFTICWRNTSDDDVMRKKREGIKETVEILSVCELRFSISFEIFLCFLFISFFACFWYSSQKFIFIPFVYSLLHL